MATSVAFRRRLIELSKPDWLLTRIGIRMFFAFMLVTLATSLVLTAIGRPMLVPAVTWAAMVPIVVPGILRLRRQNRRRDRQGTARVGEELPVLYGVGWAVIVLIAVSESWLP